MKALVGRWIEVMIATPHEMLAAMSDYRATTKYVAVGSEPFLKCYGDNFANVTFPALKNIQNLLNEAGADNTIKATIPFNAAVYDSLIYNPVSSVGKFRADIANLIEQIVEFLSSNDTPFV
ncbi:glucan endo-1,3-beta-glucosidase 8 [Canna indica]|uniref:Glucan endo-1,3-beta-glucosidase 8 n=1 Tax=Canna indica TaxID=4628 RepID=A0AAQ3K4Y1_9LILI|nr:glucan endo-1,3-beta-glucosidase 8 [Canna indica]